MIKYLPILLLIFSFQIYAQVSDEVYYPLKVGNQWTYSQFGDLGEQIVSVVDFSSEYNAYMLTEVSKMATALPITQDILIDKRKTGILQIGSRGGLFNTDWLFSSKVLLEYPLELNKSWTEDTKERTTKYTVVGFVDLKVEAGQFSNVCKIKEVVSEQKKKSKKTNIIMVYFHYFAPNVGLIKVEGSYKDKPVTIIKELTDYKVK